MARYFPNLIDAYLKYSSGHESTERVRKWSFVSVLAASLERRVWIDRAHYYLFPNLYVFIIGRSGLIKKTTSTGIAVNFIRELDDVRIMAEMVTKNALIEQLVSAQNSFTWNNKEIKQAPVFAYASELAVFLSEVFGSLTELLTTLYDCIPYDSSKPWTYHPIMRGERKIYGPCLNILGASTATWLRKCIPDSDKYGGFTSRIIFVVENNPPDKLVAWPVLSQDDELTRLRIISDLREVHALAGEMKPTDQARKDFSLLYEFIMREEIPNNQDPRMTGYLSRKGDTVLKLAMVHSAARGDSKEITRDDLLWASDEINDLEPLWTKAFHEVIEEEKS